MKDWILELNENTEKLRAILFRNRLMTAIIGGFLMFLALFQCSVLHAACANVT